MKKIMTILAAFALTFALAACTNGSDGPIDMVFEEVEATVESVEETRVLVDTELGKIWFSYEDTSALETGDVILVTFESGLAESDPMQGTMVEYEMITEYVEEPLVEEATVVEVTEEAVLVNTELGEIWLSYTDTTELIAGDVIMATFGPELMESYPMQSTMQSYEMITKFVPKLDMTASEILNEVVNKSIEAGVEYGGSMEGVINDDNKQWYLGAGDFPEFLDTAVYAPMMNVDVSLIVVLKVEMDQVEDLEATLWESIDPARMVCVTFDLEEDVVIDSYGDTVILIINKQFEQEIHEQFVALQ